MSREPEPKKEPPVLEVRFTYRAQRQWVPGSLEVTELIELPEGCKPLSAAQVCYDVLADLRRRLT